MTEYDRIWAEDITSREADGWRMTSGRFYWVNSRQKEWCWMMREEGATDFVKHDTGKPRWSTVPWDAMKDVVLVLTYGGDKYDDDNWARGADYSRYYNACMRHITAWWTGETNDPDTGKNHLAHAMCCLLFLAAYQLRGIGVDNRPIIRDDSMNIKQPQEDDPFLGVEYREPPIEPQQATTEPTEEVRPKRTYYAEPDDIQGAVDEYKGHCHADNITADALPTAK